MRIAIISPWNPWPVDSGSRQRADLIIRGLSERHDVFVIHGLQQPTHEIPALASSPASVQQFMSFRWPRGEAQGSKPQQFSLDIRPRDIQRMHAFIPDLSGPLQTFKPDVILALEADGAFIASQQATVGAVPIVVDQWEPSRIKTARILTRLRSLVFWRSIMKRMTAITVVTEREKNAALDIVGIQPPTSVIENEAVRNPDYSRNPNPRSMLFCGNLDYIPNRDGILWFIRSVLPTIQKEMSGIHLEIVGHGAPLCPDGLPYGVTQRGWVDDISACYGSAALAINPVHSGHGSRVKNQCAIIHGVPLVSFPDGGASSPGPGVQMIDDAEHPADAFSAACIAFLHNPPDIQLPRSVSPSETKLVASLENLLVVAAGVLG